MKGLSIELDVAANRLDKAISFMKFNNDEQDDTSFTKMGSRMMHSIISGQFQSEDYDLLNQIGLQDDQAHKYPGGKENKRKLIRALSLFANKIAFIDDKISSKLLLRYDFPASMLSMQSMQCQHQLDRFNQRSQFSEGLNRLVNIFEIYKTPLSHYQKSYERACRFVKRELVPRVVEAQDGHLKYMLFDLISSKGSALFKNIVNKLDYSFGRLDLDEPIRVETDKVKTKLRRELDLQVRAFKEFIDLEENQRASAAKQQQIAH